MRYFFVFWVLGLLSGHANAYDCLLDTNDDGDSDTNLDTDSGASSGGNQFRVACGDLATAGGNNSVAIGARSRAFGFDAIGIGNNATADGAHGVAIGRDSLSNGLDSSSYGYRARARSEGAISIGSNAGFINGSTNTSSRAAIGIGFHTNIDFSSPGAIAIGGDSSDADTTGADVSGARSIALGVDAKANAESAIALGGNSQATAAGAIAIGADVVADKANTMTVGVPIEVRRDDGTTKVLVEETSATVSARTLFEISNPGNTKFLVTNTDKNESWSFANPGNGFRLSRQGSGQVELEIKNNGNATLAGSLTQNSDVNSKQGIKQINQQDILNKVMELPITEWRYKDDPGSMHIGPMAQDFYQAFELGHTDKGISSIDTGGVALAAIQAVKNEKDIQIQALTTKNNRLEAQLVELRFIVTELLTQE